MKEDWNHPSVLADHEESSRWHKISAIYSRSAAAREEHALPLGVWSPPVLWSGGLWSMESIKAPEKLVDGTGEKQFPCTHDDDCGLGFACNFFVLLSVWNGSCSDCNGLRTWVGFCFTLAMRFIHTKRTSRRNGDVAQSLLEPGDESDEVLLLVVVAVTPHLFFGRSLPLPNDPLLNTDEILSSKEPSSSATDSSTPFLYDQMQWETNWASTDPQQQHRKILRRIYEFIRNEKTSNKNKKKYLRDNYEQRPKTKINIYKWRISHSLNKQVSGQQLLQQQQQKRTSGHPPTHIPNKANKNENKINFFWTFPDTGRGQQQQKKYQLFWAFTFPDAQQGQQPKNK